MGKQNIGVDDVKLFLSVTKNIPFFFYQISRIFFSMHEKGGPIPIP